MLTLVLDIYALYSDLPAYDLMKGGNMLKRKKQLLILQLTSKSLATY